MTSADAYNQCLNELVSFMDYNGGPGDFTNVVTETSCPPSTPPPSMGSSSDNKGPSSNGCSPPNSAYIGSNVNFSSGNLFHPIMLTSVPGTNPKVDLTLSYNSFDDGIGSLGPGWRHSYATKVTLYALGYLLLAEEDGREIVFQETSQGGGVFLPLDQYGRDGTTLQKFTDGSYQMTRKDGTQYGFDPSGVLTAITGRNGNSITLGYTGSNLVTITDNAYSRTVELGYVGGRLETVTDAAGRTTWIGYDPSGYLRTITDNAARTTSFDYDANGRLYSKTEPLGRTIVYGYTAEGKLETATDNATGAVASVEYYPSENKAVFHQRNGGTKTVVYDPALDLPVQVTQADNTVINYGYDNTGRLTSVSGPGQYSLARQYVGNITYETDGLNQTSTFTYNDFGQLLQAEDPEGRTTVFHYDGRGILDWVQNSAGERTDFEVTVHPQGKVTAITDAMGRRSEITYDVFGYPQTFTDNTGLRTDFVYDNVGNLRSVTDPSGIMTQYVYDNVNRPTQVVLNDNTTTNIEYVDNVAIIRDANNHVTTIEYTDLGQPGTVLDALDRLTRFEYTYDGCPSCGGAGGDLLHSVTDNNAHVTEYRYDLMSRLERVIDALDNVTRYAYWPEGNLATVIDAKNRTTTYYLDPVGRLTDVVDALQGATGFDYTPSGFLDNVIDANENLTRYAYDNVGRVTQVTSPDTGITTYDYYPDGTIHYRTDAKGVMATFSYDSSARLTGVTFPDPADDRSYSYDNVSSSFGLGRLTGMADPSGSTVYHYDSVGRLASEVRTILGVVYTTSYAYDNVGNLTSITYPSGRMVEYAYNPVNRPELVQATKDTVTQTLASSFVYDNVYNRTSVTLGNGIVEGKGYDALDRVAAISSPPALGLMFGYDAVGNMTSMTDNVSASPSPPLGTTTYDYVANRLDNVVEGGITRAYAYDNTGNTISDGTLEYVYNQDGRLFRVMAGANVVAEYKYEGKGQRTIKTTPAGTVVYHYDPQGRLIEETDASGNLLVDYVNLDDRPVAQVRPDGAQEKTYYYHTDHLGTTRAMTDANQTLVWKIAFDPFGNELGVVVQTVENNLRFPGQYFDAESGLHYNYFRDYDPRTGRFIEPDPIGLAGGVNRYGYAAGNPVNFTDPRGLRCTYSQSTGSMVCVNDQTGQEYYREQGYAGRGSGRNNPAAQGQVGIGPLPRGEWETRGNWYDSPNTGRNTIRLSPLPGNECLKTTRDCDSFRIHGDNARHDASRGCVVLPPNRTIIPSGEIVEVIP